MRATTLGSAAIAAALTTPSAVSHRATTANSPRRRTCSGASALASMTVRYGVAAIAARSASNAALDPALDTALTRTMARAGSGGGGELDTAARLARAASFASGA